MTEETFLTIVAVTFSGHSTHQLRQFVAGLYCQTDPNWKCKIYYDVTDPGDYRYYSGRGGFGIAWYDPRIEFIVVNPAKGDYGNHNRLAGLMSTGTEWVHFTNVDNQITPKFVETARQHKEDCDILAWGCLHNYAHGRFYEVLDPEPRVDHIDYSSFMIKTELMKGIGFAMPKWTGQDGLIVETAVAKGAVFKKLRCCLTVHN